MADGRIWRDESFSLNKMVKVVVVDLMNLIAFVFLFMVFRKVQAFTHNVRSPAGISTLYPSISAEIK